MWFCRKWKRKESCWDNRRRVLYRNGDLKTFGGWKKLFHVLNSNFQFSFCCFRADRFGRGWNKTLGYTSFWDHSIFSSYNGTIYSSTDLSRRRSARVVLHIGHNSKDGSGSKFGLHWKELIFTNKIVAVFDNLNMYRYLLTTVKQLLLQNVAWEPIVKRTA